MSKKYVSSVQQRVLAVLDVLMQAGLGGMTNSEIAEHVRCGADKVTRDVANLVYAGYVEGVPERTGSWRVTARVSRIANSVLKDIHIRKQGLVDIEQQYLGGI